MARPAILFLAAFLLAGCVLGPDYRRPADAVPAQFSRPAGTAPLLATTPWWLGFADPKLTGLIDRARAANPDLARAAAGVAEARAALAQARAGGTPVLDATAGASFARGFQAPSYYSRATGAVSTGFDASWELDLWGRNARMVQAASANAEAVQADADDAMLSLLGEVARAYVALRGTQAQRAAVQAAIDNQRRANELARGRFDGGDGTRLEMLQGQTLLAQLQAQMPVLEAQLQVLSHALSTLCGDPPATLDAQLAAPAPIPQAPMPDAGIPADLLRRRPDVRAAERRLASGIALVGAATAERYPSLTLSGSLGLGGSALPALLATPLFALAPSLKLPLLDGGQREAAVDIRAAQAEQARFAYRAAVLRALREVEDALAQLRGETLHRDQIRLTIAGARRVVETARNLYALGATDFLQVLDAQRVLNQAQDALAQAEAARAIQAVALFKALGGGWQAAP